MEIDNEIFRIFQALDSQNQGFFDKNEFLEKLINFISTSDEIEEKTIEHIRQLMEPYSRVGPDEFREIYLKLDQLDQQEESRLSTVSTISTMTMRSRSSSSCSDIDERAARSIAGRTTSTSATRLGRDLLAASRASLQRMIEGPLVQDAASLGLKLLNAGLVGPDEDSAGTEGGSQGARELALELAQERRRYETERDLHRGALARISELEHALHDQEAEHRTRTEQARQQQLQELNALGLARDTAEMEADTRYQSVEQKHQALCREHENLQHRCQELTDKIELVKREARHWQSTCHENETILLEYKTVASRQITELQSERDQMEMTNLQLYTELQTVKHLAPPSHSTGITKHYSLTSPVPPVSVRQRAVSVIGSPVSPNQRYSIEVVKKSDSIENETGRLVHLLTMENRNLVERIAHLETVGFYQRQKLEAANCLSLAAEMEQLNLEELKTALTVERETVRTLQKYMTSLTNKLLLAGMIEVFQNS